MKFDKLNETIPYVLGGKQKVLTMQPYRNITLAMPGRHAKDTVPEGGDFVVMVSQPPTTTFDYAVWRPDWENHQFTHTDIFKDLQVKTNHPSIGDWNAGEQFIAAYYDVIKGADPMEFSFEASAPGIYPRVLLYAVQCLAVAEYRRYGQHEAAFGGRYLPFRFSAGIVERLWTDTDAAEKQRYGRQGVQQLERNYGTPSLTRKLMS